uniref:Glutamate receptor n=1 Tax=Paramormyrops kingsleyae TaxID=1676925 RepID=A0A3B3SYL3_9TELE|nr:glutamate receptor U1-like [Paramormyrops kingsleyae]
MKSKLGIIMCVTVLLTAVCDAGPSTLSVTTIKQEPYTMPKGTELEGYCMDLLSELSKKLSFKYNVHLVKDGNYGRQDERGNWNGMIGEVLRGEADLAVAPLTLTATREKVVEMSKPFMQTGISFIIHKDMGSNDPDLFNFLCPFSTETWVGILVAYLVTGVCIYIVSRLSPCEWSEPQTEENSFSLMHSLWYTAGAIALQGAGPHPKALSGRVIVAIWWFFVVVLLASYFANLSSAQQSDKPQVSLATFEDLANQDMVEYGTLSVSSTLTFFKNSNNLLYRRIYENMERKKSFVSSFDEGTRRAQKGNYAFIGESVSLDLAASRYCNLDRSREVIGMRGYSIVGPIGSSIMKNVSVAILQLSEAGELDYLRNKWWSSSCMQEGSAASSGHPHRLKGAFVVLGLGLGLGVMLALLELISSSRKSAKEQKKNCCSVLSAELSQRLGTSGAQKTQETTDKSKP